MKNFFHLKKSHAPVFSSEHVSWRERLSEDAYVGWVLIISISVLTAAVLISLAAQLFFLINSGGVTAPQSVATTTKHTGFDPKNLDSIMSYFGAKASTTAALEHGYQGPPDPSQ